MYVYVFIEANVYFLLLAIKLSESAFSSMKDRIGDDNDENEVGEVKQPKPVPTTEKNQPVKNTKPTKPTSTSLTLKQALQNVSERTSEQEDELFCLSNRSVLIN